MMIQYSEIIHKKFLKIVIIPFLTPKLSSYWVELITPVKASLARPLIKSLKFESVVKIWCQSISDLKFKKPQKKKVIRTGMLAQ